MRWMDCTVISIEGISTYPATFYFNQYFQQYALQTMWGHVIWSFVLFTFLSIKIANRLMHIFYPSTEREREKLWKTEIKREKEIKRVWRREGEKEAVDRENQTSFDNVCLVKKSGFIELSCYILHPVRCTLNMTCDIF